MGKKPKKHESPKEQGSSSSSRKDWYKKPIGIIVIGVIIGLIIWVFTVPLPHYFASLQKEDSPPKVKTPVVTQPLPVKKPDAMFNLERNKRFNVYDNVYCGDDAFVTGNDNEDMRFNNNKVNPAECAEYRKRQQEARDK